MPNMKRAYVYFWETPIRNGIQTKGFGYLLNCTLTGGALVSRIMECVKDDDKYANLCGLTEIPNGNNN